MRVKQCQVYFDQQNSNANYELKVENYVHFIPYLTF